MIRCVALEVILKMELHLPAAVPEPVVLGLFVAELEVVGEVLVNCHPALRLWNQASAFCRR